MAQRPSWIEAALDQWRTLIDSGVGDHAMSAATGWPENKDGLSRHRCRIVLEYAKTLREGDEDAPGAEGLIWDGVDWNPSTGRYITMCKSTPSGIVVTTKETHEAIVAAYSNWHGKPATITEMCRRFAMSRKVMIEYLRRHQITHDHEPFSREEVMSTTVEELAEQSYQMRRHELRQESERVAWKATVKDAGRWRNFDEAVLSPLTEAIEAHALSYSVPLLEMPEAERPHAIVIAPMDLHWGLYSSPREVHDNYDRVIARGRLMSHTADIVSRLSSRPEQIISVLGSDWFHVDGGRPATTAGTAQDIDGTVIEILESGCQLAVDHIDALRQVSDDVRVHVIPGNHDDYNSQVLRLYLMAWYRGVDDVTIADSPRSRQHTTYGTTMLTLHHGKVKPARVAGAMLKEAAEMFRRSTHRVCFGGHIHHETAKQAAGVNFITVPSLCGQSKWEMYEGYADGSPGLQCYTIDNTAGLVATLRSMS